MAAGSGKSTPPRALRFVVTPKAEILDGTTTIKAIIQDVSDSGLLLVCSREFARGQQLGLRLQLAPGSFIDCTIEVRHSNDLGTGARIISMDEKNRRAYDQYLQEYFSQQLGKLG